MGHTTRRVAPAIAVVAFAFCMFAAPAMSKVKVSFSRLQGFAAPGTPAKYDKVGALKIGSPSARNVLVLNPGTSASATYFAPLAKTIVAQAPNWQVWAVERRENLLEDQSRLDQAKAKRITVKQAFDYYLGYLADSSISPHFQGIPDSDVAYAKQWGMNTEIEDLARVVKAARKGGRNVVMGGHSLGGSITSAYATWDFNGKPGAKDLSGLVFIDGGSSPTPVTPEQANQSLADLQKGSPWLTFGGFPAPLAGLFNSTGSFGVRLDPNSPSIGQAFRFLPDNLKPPVPVTNIAQYGYALDTATSPTSLIAAQAHIGRLASSGKPRGWTRAGELTPILRFADMFSGWGLKGLDGTAWYHPQRLTIDAGAVAAGNANPAQAVLDVHSTHGRDLSRKLRIYAFGAALGGRRVLDAAKALAGQSGIPRRNLVLVDRHTTYAHNDPNSASPKNDFVKNLLPFLGKLERK